MASPQAHLDALAQQQGFHDYATWAAYNAKQQARLNGASSGAPAAPTNWLQNLMESIPGHPAQLFRYIGDKFGGATGQ